MIQDLKDLKALFKLCRTQGVTDIKVAGVEIKFGNLPEVPHGTEVNSEENQGETISEDNLIYWSSPQGQEELDKKTGISS